MSTLAYMRILLGVMVYLLIFSPFVIGAIVGSRNEKRRKAQAAINQHRYNEWFATLTPIEQLSERQRLNTEQNARLANAAFGVWLLDGFLNPKRRN